MMRCESCGRGIFQTLSACPSCGGSVATVPDRPKIDRHSFFEKKLTCEGCEHYGRHLRDGQSVVGCGKLEKPCEVEQRWVSGRDDWCPIGRLSGTPAHDVSSLVANPCSRLDEVALVTTHFNPCGFDRLRETYEEWVPSLGPLVEALRCYELVFDGEQPEIPGSIVIRGRLDTHGIWQKEALINRALRDTPLRCNYFCWIDHDLVMSDPDWLTRAIQMIDEGAIAVQLFDAIDELDVDRKVTGRRPGAVARRGWGNPGAAWIADRRWLDRIGGLHPFHIVGGGDQVFYFGVGGRGKDRYLSMHRGPFRREMERWLAAAQDARGDRSSRSLDSTAYHLFHGHRRDRQHRRRESIATRYSLDPERDLRITDEGILEWATDKPDLHSAVGLYFENRRDDG